MKLHQFALSTLVLTTLTLGLATPAAAETNIHRARGNTAFATWAQAAGCSFSDVQINVTEGVTRNTGTGPVESTVVYVYGNLYDMCYGSPNYGTQVFYTGTFETEPGTAFTYAGLRTAALKVTMPVNEYGSRGVIVGSLTIELSWVGTNTYFNTGSSSSRQVGPEGIYVQRQFGMQRSANVTGSVLLDGVSVTNGDSLAEVSRASEGTLTIIR